jgi:hypothetical protein
LRTRSSLLTMSVKLSGLRSGGREEAVACLRVAEVWAGRRWRSERGERDGSKGAFYERTMRASTASTPSL